jgi:crotonobetainyl-CoA:carnitine CoA-transferase CaiB-like acyl-CoA transferase
MPERPVTGDVQLDGVRVVDLTTLLPGPYATQLLADAGAEVIKVERPGTGDEARAMAAAGAPDVFSAVNRGKRSVALDLSTDGGREAFAAVAADADVVIEGFRPGVVDRLGVDYEAVREYNPGVVYCSLTGYGATGPHRDRAGHDLNYAAMAGLVDATRSRRGDPAIPGVPVADLAGGLFVAFSILGALLSRELGDGTGEYVDVAMTDVLLSFSQPLAADALAGGDPTGRESHLTGRFPCYDLYATADGGHVALAALEPRFWRAFCEAVDRPDLVDRHLSPDPEVRAALRAELDAVFGARPREEWAAFGADHGEAMVTPVRSVREAVESDHAAARGILRGEDSPAGPRVGFPAIPSGGLDPDETVPELGEHTGDVLRAAGYDDAALDRLRAAGAIP